MIKIARKKITYSSRLIGSVVSDFLGFRWERPLRSLRNDSRKDFFKDLRLDMGLSSALAISVKIDSFQFFPSKMNAH